MLHISRRNSADSLKLFGSFGTHLLDHLTADGACLTGGQVTVVTVGQIDADFACLISILNLSIASRAWGTLIWLLFFIPKSLLLHSSEENTLRRKYFLFRTLILTSGKKAMNVNWRKGWEKMKYSKKAHPPELTEGGHKGKCYLRIDSISLRKSFLAHTTGTG